MMIRNKAIIVLLNIIIDINNEDNDKHMNSIVSRQISHIGIHDIACLDGSATIRVLLANFTCYQLVTEKVMPIYTNCESILIVLR